MSAIRANERQERADEQMWQTEERMQLLVESVEDYAIFMLDPEGRVTTWNTGAQRIKGYSPEEVVGKHFSMFYPPEVRAAGHPEHELEIARRDGRYEEESWRIRKDGSRFWANVVITAIHDPESGRLRGFAKVTRDLTERRRHEETARLLYEKTKALAELKTQFFAHVSHELRTPLALILSGIERLLHTIDAADGIRRDVETIARNARLLLRHANELLEVAKLEAGRVKPNYAETDISELGRFVASHFEVLAQEKQIALDVQAPAPLSAQVDPELIQRVIMNLLSNSFRFTPSGGRVRLTVYELDDQVQLEVADSGPGIPVDQREEVFELFRQLEGEPTRRFGGTGLGLSIARELTLLHRGSIEADTAPEGGALFVVRLPRSAPTGAAVDPATEIDPTAEVRQAVDELHAQRVALPPVQSAAEGALVLVVEDNPEMNRFLCESLAPDYRVATAFDGKDGLRKADELRPDLILTDIVMPEMNGDQLMRAIRLRPELDGIPIVLLTAKDDDELRASMLSAGAQDYLTKPVSLAELRARIDNLIAAKRLEQALRLAEAKATGILTVSAEAFISIDEEQRITMFNEGAEKIFGRSKSEVIGAPLETLIPERFRGRHGRYLEAFAAGADTARRLEQHGGVRVFGLRKNGEEFPADTAISKLEVGGERILTVVIRDMTEPCRIEREQRFLAELGPALAGTLQFDETVAKIAEAAVGSLGDFCSVDVVEGDGEVRRLKVVARDPDREEAAETFMRLGLDRQRPHLIWPVVDTRQPVLISKVRPDMIAAWARTEDDLRVLRALDVRSALAVPLIARSKLLGVIALVSSTRAYGLADLRVAEELAHRAALALDNARLYRAARAATEFRDQVLRIVAHDLRNPLNVIALQASLLQRQKSGPERQSLRATETIERAVRRMNRLIQDLLDVGCMEAGQLSVDRAPVHTHELLCDVLDSQRPAASAASLELRQLLPSNLPDVWADHDRLLQVFENLIGNAMKFSAPGGCITVGAAPRSSDTLFWVEDTGPGITRDDLPHLFDLFWQARGSGRQGAGLGLPIVKGIVEAHRGHVWVESTPGAGTTFYFTIPSAPRSAQRDAPALPLKAMGGESRR